MTNPRRGYRTAPYTLREQDVKKALKALNRPSSAGTLYEALRDLIGHAEKMEETA